MKRILAGLVVTLALVPFSMVGCADEVEDVDQPEAEEEEFDFPDETYSVSVYDGGELIYVGTETLYEQLRRNKRIAEAAADGLGLAEEAIRAEPCAFPADADQLVIYDQNTWTGNKTCFGPNGPYLTGRSPLANFCRNPPSCSLNWVGAVRSYKTGAYSLFLEKDTANHCCAMQNDYTNVGDTYLCEEQADYINRGIAFGSFCTTHD